MSSTTYKDKLRMPLRYCIAVVLGMISILGLNSLSVLSKNDNVATVGLFSCIIAVAGEDISMGPIIHKAILRSIGVCIGGFCGYLCLYIPNRVVLVTNRHEICLVVIPSLFCFIIQWLTKGGWEYGTNWVKEKKATHMIIQLQVAFGVVYVGSWNSNTIIIDTAIIRTIAILIGCLVLLISSLCSYPQTSLYVCCNELASTLKSSGKLIVTVCADKTHGRLMQPYDHVGKAIVNRSSSASATTSKAGVDDHVKLLDSIDSKLTRVQSLQPFLLLEPSWVPGFSRHLICKQELFSKPWITLISVVYSRLLRIRCTYTVLDSLSRIDSDQANDDTSGSNGQINNDGSIDGTIDDKIGTEARNGKLFQEEIGFRLEALSLAIKIALDNVANYIQSPFLTEYPYVGNQGLKSELKECLIKIKVCIHHLVHKVITEVKKGNKIARNKHFADDITTKTAIDVPTIIPNTFRERNLSHRQRIGHDVLDCWHRIYPMRTFCTISITCAVQSCSLLVEIISFMNLIANYTDTEVLEPTGRFISLSNDSQLDLELTSMRNVPLAPQRSNSLSQPDSQTNRQDRTYSLLHADDHDHDDSSPSTRIGATVSEEIDGLHSGIENPATDTLSFRTDSKHIMDELGTPTFEELKILEFTEADDSETIRAIESHPWYAFTKDIDATMV